MKSIIAIAIAAGMLLFQQGCSLDALIYSRDGGDGTPTGYKILEPGWGDSIGFPIADSMRQMFSLTSETDKDSESIIGLYLGDERRIATDTVILFCHGNGSTLDLFWEQMSAMAHTGGLHRFGVMAIDYRGYGNSTGVPTPDGFVADVDAAFRWLKARGMTSDRLVIYGYSLGGVAAVPGAVKSETLTPAKMILEAPFTGPDAPMQSATGLSLQGTLISELGTVNTVEDIALYPGPLLWMHCEDDVTVPIIHGKSLFEAHKGVRKLAVNPPEGGHYLINPLGQAGFQQLLLDFLTE